MRNNVLESPEAIKASGEANSDDVFAAYRFSLPEKQSSSKTLENQEPKKDQPIPREKALDVQAKELAEVIKKCDGNLDKKSEEALSKLLEKAYDKGVMEKLMNSFRENLKGTNYQLSLRINPDDDEHYYLQIGKDGKLVGGSSIKFKAKH